MILNNLQSGQNSSPSSTSASFTMSMHDQMLDSNRDDVKLEAMRCITVMTAKGKFSVPRTLFPHIVKNVNTKNAELKKLIHLYVTNFADQEPDLALLPVASLQKSLKSPNALVRSSALKVLTSMRLNILSGVFMASVANLANDLSPYVRKTVAHSIIKIYRLEPGLKEDIVQYIERSLNDKNSMVLSSTIAAFDAVCPERYDLLERHYKRLCFVLADCNEWGQTVLLRTLTKYIVDRNQVGDLQVDPSVLLRAAKPLVHSTNSAVVMAVIRLYIAIGNQNDVRSSIPKPLIRLLYSHREMQLIALRFIKSLIKDNQLGQMTNPTEENNNNDGDETKPSDEKEEQDNGLAGAAAVVDGQQGEDKSDNDGPQIEELTNRRDDGITKPTGDVQGDDKSASKSQVNQDLAIETSGTEETQIKKETTDGIAIESDQDEQGEDDEEEEESEVETEEDEDEDEEDSDEQDEEESEEESEESSSESEDIDDVIEPDSRIDGDQLINYKIEPIGDNPLAFREIFRPLFKSFFVKHSDCTQIKLAKLDILTNLSSPVNVTQILRELQAYIAAHVEDKKFVGSCIHAIGQCSSMHKDVSSSCLTGLINLLSNNHDHIVAEAIVVLRSQIMSEETISTIIKQLTKLLPKVIAPQARVAILWILTEFCYKNKTAAKCTPNILRLVAKNFRDEDNFVKLQSLTLTARFLSSLDSKEKPELYNKIQLLASYLFNLAKYDTNYDVRDRGRFLRKLLEDPAITARVFKYSHLEKDISSLSSSQQQEQLQHNESIIMLES